jgi:hypothetical protein
LPAFSPSRPTKTHCHPDRSSGEISL